MHDLEPITLKSLLIKMQAIADQQHNGRLIANCVTVFKKLSAKEQKIFLEDVVNILVISIDRNYNDICNYKRDYYEECSLDPLKDPEYVNKIELIKLKSWLVKITTIAIILFLGTTAIMALFFGYNDKMSEMFGPIKDISKIIFGS